MSLAVKLTLAALIAAAGLAASALAQTPGELGSVKVGYGDLNMSTTDGGEVLLKRIRLAAGKACNEAVTHSPMTPRIVSACRRDAVEQTVRDMGAPTLTAALSGQHSTTLALR